MKATTPRRSTRPRWISNKALRRLLVGMAPGRHFPSSHTTGWPATPRRTPIFIVGPPRCGSTILYQAMTNWFQVLYVDNLAASWQGELMRGMAVSMRLFGMRPHNNFTAWHGDTLGGGGWHAPSENGAFWYQWIPDDQHFVGREHLSTTMVQGLRRQVHTVQNRWRLPLVTKNLHVGQRLAWTHASLPAARYVWLRRDLDEVAASIMRARASLKIPPGSIWSTRPRVHDDLMELPEREMVRGQVTRLEEQVRRDLGRMRPEQIREVSYANLDRSAIDELGEWLGLTHRQGGVLPEFKVPRVQ